MYQPLTDYDKELEAVVLGILLLEPQAYGKVFRLLIADCFYNQSHGTVFASIAELYDEGYPVDTMTVARKLIERGYTTLDGDGIYYYLTQLYKDVVMDAHLEYWCVKLRELAIRRTSIAFTTSGLDRNADALDMAETVNEKLRVLMDVHASDDWQDGSQVAMKLLKHMDDMKSGGGDWVTTGVREVDELNGGLRPGQLILIGARPGMGKSAFMGKMIVDAAVGGLPVGVISLEMDNKDIFARMVSYQSGIAFYQLDRNEFYSEPEYQAAMRAISTTASLPIHFSDKAQVTMKDIRAKAEKLKRKHNIKMLAIDYLQLIESDAAKNSMREQEVAKISKGCKNLSRLLAIPIIVLVQLNREADGVEPQLKHLRESGSLEQDADIVMMLFRETDTEDPTLKSKATLFVRKWRNGTELKVDMHFDGPRMKFSAVSDRDILAEPLTQSNGLASAGRRIIEGNNDNPF